jgi:hypothetical protein
VQVVAGAHMSVFLKQMEIYKLTNIHYENIVYWVVAFRKVKTTPSRHMPACFDESVGTESLGFAALQTKALFHSATRRVQPRCRLSSLDFIFF